MQGCRGQGHASLYKWHKCDFCQDKNSKINAYLCTDQWSMSIIYGKKDEKDKHACMYRRVPAKT